jgi:hypothetical protein
METEKQPLFKVGDNLKPLDFDVEMYGLIFVTITRVNTLDGIYHWEAPYPPLGGVMKSGYFLTIT